MSENCGGCRFWKMESGEMADCRRYPPIGFDQVTILPIWPATFRIHWCGEFQPRPEKEEGA